MGSSHSRDVLLTGPDKMRRKLTKKRMRFPDGKKTDIYSESPAYFILNLNGSKMKVVNASTTEVQILTVIIKRHCRILKSGWDGDITFSFKLKTFSRHSVIQLVADILLVLYTVGWEPMTPIDMGIKNEAEDSNISQTAICFRKKNEHVIKDISGLSMRDVDTDSCMCLEKFQSNHLRFLNISNTVLYDMIKICQSKWPTGIAGVSMAVHSVVSDYTSDTLNILPASQMPELVDAKYIKFNGHPWSVECYGSKDLENLQMSIIACLFQHYYKLSMALNINQNSRVIFFIRFTDDQGTVHIPSIDVLREQDGIPGYRTVSTNKESFLRKYCKTNSLKKGVRRSTRRKSTEVKRRSVDEYIRRQSIDGFSKKTPVGGKRLQSQISESYGRRCSIGSVRRRSVSCYSRQKSAESLGRRKSMEGRKSAEKIGRPTSIVEEGTSEELARQTSKGDSKPMKRFGRKISVVGFGQTGIAMHYKEQKGGVAWWQQKTISVDEGTQA